MKTAYSKTGFRQMAGPLTFIVATAFLIPDASATLSGRKVGLDPGHGAGVNQGVYIAEGTWTLDGALRARNHLLNDGAQVIMTRTSGTNISIPARYGIFNSNNVHIGISVHSNASSTPAANGIESYYCNLNHANSSYNLANRLRLRALSMVHNDNRGTKECWDAGRQIHFGMIRYSNMPAALPEYFFHTNPWENQNIHNTVSGRENIGRSLYAAICDYFGQAPNFGQPAEPDKIWQLKNTLGGGEAEVTFDFGRASDTPIVGDWDGNGSVTPGVIRGNTWYLKNSLSGGDADIIAVYGQPGDYPLAGDWNGNGKWTIGIVRGNMWHLKNSISGGDADHTFPYGWASDIPVVGDWDGNGTMTPGIVRNGREWHLRNSIGGGSAHVSIHFGAPGDEPVVGDWNGNGTMTPGVVRNGNQWYLKNSLSGGAADVDFVYGTSGDFPLAGDWNGNGTTTHGIFRP